MDSICEPHLVLDLQLYKQDGASFMSRDACGHLSTATGASWRISGRYFDGIDDVVDCGNAAALTPGSNWSFDMWIKGAETTGTAVRNAFELHVDGDNRGYLSWPISGSGVVRFYAKINGIGYSGFDPVAQVDLDWHHFAVTFEGTTWRAYLDGAHALTAAKGDFGSLVGTPTVKVGGGANGHFKGNIGEVRLHRRLPTPLEIQHDYLATKWRYR
jgi:hypothetical protein